MPTNKISRIDRFAAVKLRQRISQELRSNKPRSVRASYNFFLIQGWIPEKGNGELLEELGFKGQVQLVKKDMNSSVSAFFVNFLHRAVLASFNDYYKQCKPARGYNGMREIARMTELQETTIRDILILNGAIR